MKYNPPYGSADPNAPYVDRNTPGAVSGSRVPAAAVEHPQREIMAVIASAGLSGSDEDLTQLLQAIQQIVAQITGGGDTQNFVTYPVAQARLPIYPEVLTADGRLPIVSPSAGQVRIPAGYDFLHRGINLRTTVQQDFVTAANKTYHLRWTPGAGYVLKDLADGTYNPGALGEGAEAFDSAFDDILFARVVTNGSNVATITNLANKARLTQTGEELQNNTIWEEETLPSALQAPDGAVVNVDFARKPIAYLTGFSDVTVQQGTPAAGQEINVVVQSLSRYRIKAIYQRTTSPSGAYVGWAATA